jgi:hypothetical protein
VIGMTIHHSRQPVCFIHHEFQISSKNVEHPVDDFVRQKTGTSLHIWRLVDGDGQAGVAAFASSVTLVPLAQGERSKNLPAAGQHIVCGADVTSDAIIGRGGAFVMSDVNHRYMHLRVVRNMPHDSSPSNFVSATAETPQLQPAWQAEFSGNNTGTSKRREQPNPSPSVLIARAGKCLCTMNLH